MSRFSLRFCVLTRGGRSSAPLGVGATPERIERADTIPRASCAPLRSHPHEWGLCSTLRRAVAAVDPPWFVLRAPGVAVSSSFPLSPLSPIFERMKVVVLGAGLLGVTSAYYLQQLGHEVTVLDRQAAPAAETSFANGGQISVSHAEPWANPAAPFKVLQWLGQEDAPLLFRLRADA